MYIHDIYIFIWDPNWHRLRMAKAIFFLKWRRMSTVNGDFLESKVTKLLMSWRCSPRSFFPEKTWWGLGVLLIGIWNHTKWRSKLGMTCLWMNSIVRHEISYKPSTRMAPVSSWVAFLVTISHCCPKTAARKGDAQKGLASPLFGNTISKMIFVAR